MKISKIFLLLIFVAACYSNAAAIDTLKLDTERSFIKWKSGTAVKEYTGTLHFNGGMAITYGSRLSAGSFVVNMESIAVEGIEDPAEKQKILDIIKSNDMFDVDNHKDATFIIKSSDPIYSKGDTRFNNRISGKMTIKGISETIAMPGLLLLTDSLNTFKGSVSIDRTKFDMKYKSGSFFEDLGDELIKDNISLDIEVYFIKQD